MLNNPLAIIAAQLFAKAGDRSVLAGHTPWALEDELMAYAKANARPGECDAAALTRLAREDETAKALARAACAPRRVRAALPRPVSSMVARTPGPAAGGVSAATACWAAPERRHASE